jgi:hypothetical protein
MRGSKDKQRIRGRPVNWPLRPATSHVISVADEHQTDIASVIGAKARPAIETHAIVSLA